MTDGYPEEVAPRSSRGRRVAIWGGGALLALLAAYGGAAWWLGDSVPRDTTVSGVAVGGMSRDEAITAIETGLGDHLRGQLTLTAGAKQATVDPATAGLTADVPGTVDSLLGFTLDPRVLWARVGGGATRGVQVSVADTAYAKAMEGVATTLRTEPKEGAVSFAGGLDKTVMPVDGVEVDVAATRKAIEGAWPAAAIVPAVVRPLEPTVPIAEFERFRTEFSSVVLSGPVTVKAGDKSFQLTPAQFVPAVTVKAQGASLVSSIDSAKLVGIVQAEAAKAGIGAQPKDAIVTYSGGKFTVTPSVDGAILDPKVVTDKVTSAITSASRTAEVTTTTQKPTFTTEIARATLPKEVISSFTTNFKPGQPRVTNIALGARRLNGAYVPPGGTFSLNKWLGQRTPDKGYVKAPGINAGRIEMTYGGGISQLSTTLFNASWFSGVKLVDWRAHSLYITRYPEGREATLDWWTIDNVFTNTTKGGILIQASTTSTSVTVTFRGIKTWNISTFKGPRFNVVSPRRVEITDPECIPQDPSSGFTVVNTRVFTQGGKEVKRESITTRYDATNEIVCTGR